MDEIWVPTHHHKRIFLDGGVTKSIVVVGQGIDIRFWNPDIIDPIIDFQKIDRKNKCSEDDYEFYLSLNGKQGKDQIFYYQHRPYFFMLTPERISTCLNQTEKCK